jgi:hypothetical protein
MKNKAFIYIAGAAAVAAGLYFIFRKRDADLPAGSGGVTPPALPGGSGASTPPAPPVIAPIVPPVAPPAPPAPLKIGDVVYSTQDQFGIFEKAIKVFAKGGTNNKGQIEKDKYAGVVRGFTPLSDLVIVENFTNPMVDKDTLYTKFRLDKKLLRKK